MRREGWRVLLAAVLATALSQPVWAAADGAAVPPGGFREGVHYQRIDPPQPVQGGEGVDVVELLWYGCRTCFILQPALARWRSRHEGEIHYRRMAAITHGGMTLLARAFYAARALGVEEQIHGPLFTAIHRHHRRLEDEAALEEFFAEQGVEPAAFRRALNSRFVARKLRQARIMSRRYGIRGAPTLVVAGRYRVDPSMVHSPEEMMAVLDHLLRLANEAASKDM
ncbi:MAG TPA: thiol:disulfide interchange protein DsbA/DsbL [Gammaproteobacteria bacterium]|nr:thiol:disulfide interchange protein DsbA/DsbL [Gammaproteobacteria bacterium]